MIVLTNGLTETADEGFLKVATSIIKRLKNDKVKIVSYDRTTSLADEHLNLNKFLISKRLVSILREKKDSVLYIPFPAKTFPTAIRIFLLSLMSKGDVQVVLVLKNHYSVLSKLLIKLSRAKIIVLSSESYEFYREFLSEDKVKYLKSGVDTDRFIPADDLKKNAIREKYGFDLRKPIILHVGHLKYGRNVNQLLNIGNDYQVILVASTLTKNEQDECLKQQLLQKENITILDEYIPNIEEIYQMSDVYFFPTVEKCNCIDVPLSCLEAAACNIPVITTEYGEMKVFRQKEGFIFIDDFSSDNLKALIEKALMLEKNNDEIRKSILDYDWQGFVQNFADL